MCQNARICLLLFVFSLFILPVFSQHRAAVMNKAIADKDYEGVVKAAGAYYNTDDDSAIAIAEREIIPSKDIFLQACGLFIKGTALYNKDNISESQKIILRLDSIIAANPAIIPDKYFKWRIFIRMFYIERRNGNYQKAMELTERNERTDTSSRHNYKILYAVNYIDLGYYDRGIALFKESIASGKTGGYTIPNIFNNIADAYREFYYKTSDDAYLDSALAYCEKSYQIAKNDTPNLPLTNALLLLRKGRIVFLKTQYQYALDLYMQGVAIPIVKQRPFTMQAFELFIADCYNHLSQYKASNEHLEKFYESYKLFPASGETIIAAHSLSSQNYEKLNNTYESLYYARLCLEESNQLGKRKEVANELFHNKALKDFKSDAERIINNQKSQNGILLVVGALLFVCILFMYLYMRQRNTISINKNNEMKQRLLLTQMNPHFIFNSVDNIQSLIYNKQDEEAISYLTKFSKLTRQILENSRENYITLSEELSMLNNYLTIQRLLYNNKFTYSIDADAGIDAEAICLPPMLTQPFIENAVKHGLKSKADGGNVQVRFYMQAGALFFEVTDNGTGLKKEEGESPQKSLSTQIVRERLSSISPARKITIHSLNIIDEDGTISGVRTFFEIPFISS